MLRSVSVVLALLWSSAVDVAARPAPCPDGRFLLPEGLLVLSPASGHGRQAVALDAGTLAFDDSCGPAQAQVKPGRKATRVTARWRACGDRKRVVLKGAIAAPACGVLRGKVKARKTAAVAFEATRSACGDGFADTAGGETCDLPADEATWALLDAAHDAVAGGATDVPISPDGTLRFVRTTTATGGTDAIVRGATTLVEWVHDGDTTSVTADQDGDGTAELHVAATRAPSRSAVVEFDADDDGVVDRTVSMEQVAPDGVQVEVTLAGQSPVGFSTTRLQEDRALGIEPATSVSSENCTADQATEAETAMVNALTDGLACLKRFGLDSVGKTMAGKVLKDGVVFRCGATSDCAQVDVVDSLTHGLLPTSLGVNLGDKFFTGEGTCTNSSMVLFHELLHVALGDWHSPSLDRNSKASLADDRVYSCTDLCFRPLQVTKHSCATCLGVGLCDAKCESYPDLPGDPPCGPRVEITSAACPGQACTCQNLLSGVKSRETVSGEASGPEGYYVRVNMPPLLGGQLTCGSWTALACPGAGSTFVCCRHESGQPSTTTFTATLPYPFQDFCACPVPPSTEVGTITAQLMNTDDLPLLEDSAPITCP